MKYWLIAGLSLALVSSAQEIRLSQIVSGVSAPTDIAHAGDGSGRIFVVQQNGIVRIVRDGSLVAQPFLDITSRTQGGGERGLLGIAFPPGFAEKQRFYVNYTDLQGATVIAMYRVSPNRDVADAGSEQIVLRIAQPASNHNGGQLLFGPDGYMYIGMGDGGGAGDPQNNAQNPQTLLGKMLRIDVESDPGRFSAPPSNPFFNSGATRPEIWALGLRNPWRFSFDRATGGLWIADVGQNRLEEINFQPASSSGGENYGWNIMEGTQCFQPNCQTQGLVRPIAEYGRADGCSVTGGYVYRGRSWPGLRGTYLYGDYCTGRIWGIEPQGTSWSNRLLLASGFRITTFGEDEAGEIYVANSANGTIHRIEGSRAPRLTSAGIVNAASFVQGLTPGSLATIFAAGVRDETGITSAPSVPLPRSLGGVTVTVNGVAAPIHVIANQNGQEQINFQVPIEARGSSNATVVVTRDGQASESVTVPVLETQPAIYVSNGRAVVVHNTGHTLVTPQRPLIPGEYAYLYATAVGRPVNEPVTGAASPNAPLAEVSGVRVTIGGVAAEVQFAGLAPGFVGVYQVNFRVPPTVAPGTPEIVIAAGAQSSPAVRVPVGAQ
jgi:uncharacterized protein (TIGR03437 family)